MPPARKSDAAISAHTNTDLAAKLFQFIAAIIIEMVRSIRYRSVGPSDLNRGDVQESQSYAPDDLDKS